MKGFFQKLRNEILKVNLGKRLVLRSEVDHTAVHVEILIGAGVFITEDIFSRKSQKQMW